MTGGIGIEEKVRAETASRIKTFPARSIWASRLGHPCERLLVLSLTRANEATPHGTDLQSIFDLGNELEKYAKRRMEDAGIEVIRAQEAMEWRGPGNAPFLITGRVDGMIRDPEIDRLIPIEIKSCSPSNFRRMAHADDVVGTMLAGPHYMQCYPAQLLLYAWSRNVPRAAWVFVDKTTGILKDRVVRIDDHLDYMEGLLKRAASVYAHINAGTLPPELGDWEVCGECQFGTVCHPSKTEEDRLALIEGMEPILDEIATLTATIKPTEKRIEALKAERDRRIEGREGYVLCGAWTGKRGKRSWTWKRNNAEAEDGDPQDRR